MRYDVFFSICHTPAGGVLPTEAEMFRNFFAQVEAADALGYGTAWVAQSHLSTQVQKRHAHPVVPHWDGEIGLNTDIFQLAHKVFARTKRIEVGSAVMNLLCNGGPVARAEQVATFATLHGVDPDERRRLCVGFSAGRFDFMNRAYGVCARDALEVAAWPALKGKVFAEACEIFLRLLRGETISSDDIRETSLSRPDFRSDSDWDRVRGVVGAPADAVIPVPRRFAFEPLKIVPSDWRRDLIELIAGTHDPNLQAELNRYAPVKVFNLSITAPAVIEDTHRRMAAAYHPDGGPWQRAHMPRTIMVFLNASPALTPAEQSTAARDEAEVALSAYWTAMEGTLDPRKVAAATDNAVVGNPDEVAAQLRERFHPEDRLMLWFDFFNHDNARVVANMEAFMAEVVPRVEGKGA